MCKEGPVHVQEAVYTILSLVGGIGIAGVAGSYIVDGTADVGTAVAWFLVGGALFVFAVVTLKITNFWRCGQEMTGVRRIITRIPLIAASIGFLLLRWAWEVIRIAVTEIIKDFS